MQLRGHARVNHVGIAGNERGDRTVGRVARRQNDCRGPRAGELAAIGWSWRESVSAAIIGTGQRRDPLNDPLRITAQLAAVAHRQQAQTDAHCQYLPRSGIPRSRALPGRPDACSGLRGPWSAVRLCSPCSTWAVTSSAGLT